MKTYLKSIVTAAFALAAAFLTASAWAAVPQLVWEGNSATQDKTLSQAVEKGKPFTLVVKMSNPSGDPVGKYLITTQTASAGQSVVPFCVASDAFTGFDLNGSIPNNSVAFYEKRSGGWNIGIGSRGDSGNAAWNTVKKGGEVESYEPIYVAFSGTVADNGQISSLVRMAYVYNTSNGSYYTLSDSVSLTISDALDTMNIKSSIAESLEFRVYLDNVQRNVDQIKQAIADIENPPAPPASATVSGAINWSEIEWDTTIENPAKTELVLTVQNDATITLDGEFAYKAITINGNVQFVAAESVYEDGCWEKKLLTASSFTASGTVMFGEIKDGFYGAYSKTENGILLRAQNKEVISINIAGGNSGDAGGDSPAANLVSGTGFYGIAPTLGSSWNNINRQWQKGGNQTITIEGPNAYDGKDVIKRETMSLSATGKNTWQDGSIANPFLRGYLDDGGGVTVEVHGVPYTKYDVIVYATSDSYRILAPITINNTKYTFKDGAVKPGSDAWGEGQYATPEIGKNALRVNDCTGDTITINAVRVGDNRATLCAVQVINKGEVVLKEDFAATIEVSTTFSAIEWNDGKTFKEGQLNMATIMVADGEGEVELTFDQPDMVLAKLTIICNRDIKLTAASALANIPQFDVSGCTGKITYSYPVTKLSTVAGGVTYAADSGSADAPVPMAFRVQEGSMTLKDATFYIGTTYSSVTSTVNMVDATVYANGDMGFGIGQATFNLSGTTTLTTEKVVLSQGDDNRVANLKLCDSSEIIVTGTNVVDSNQSSIMFGHWNGPSTFTLNDEAKFTAESAQVLVGKTANNQTININGGIFTAKGIKASASANGVNTLNLAGGEVKIGEYGIGSYGSTTINIAVQGDTKITSTAGMSITQPMTIEQGITLTFDATNGDILLMGDVSNQGTIKVIGGTVVVMQNANNGNIVTEEGGAVIYGYTVNINNCGKFAIPDGVESKDIRLYYANGSEVEITDSNDNYVYFDWQITGDACWWDYEFNNASGQAPTNDGSDKTNLSLDGDRPAVIKNGGEYVTNEVTGAISLRVPARPWRDVSSWPKEATFMFYGKMVGTDKAYQLAFGSKNNSGNQLFFATKSVADGTVDLCFSVVGAAPTVLCTMNVPNAQTANHLYAIVLKDDADGNTVVNTYLDGKLLQPYTHTGKLTLGRGFQIASGHGGTAVGYSRPADTDPATMDWLRVYDVELNAEAMTALAEIYKYVSTNGEASRTVTAADTAWTETDKWTQQSFSGAVATQSAPNADTVVKLTVGEDSALVLNLTEKANYEALEIKGTGALTLTGAQDAVVPSVSGATTIGTDVNVAYDAIAFGNVTLADNATLVFDFTTLDLTKEFSSRTIRLTGTSILGEGAKVQATGISQSDKRSAVLSYDARTQQYLLNITVEELPFTYENGVWTWGAQTLTGEDLAANPEVTRSIKSDYEASLGAYNYAVEDGVTLKQTDASATGVITVNAGGTFDINGVIDTSLRIVLNGGSLINTGSAVPVTKKQYVSLSQTAASFVGGSNELAYVCSQYAANTFDLSGATLTKKDDNVFTLRTTTITSGTIAVTGGMLVLENCTIDAEATVTFDIAAGATVDVKGTFAKNGTLNLTGAGTVICEGILPAFDSLEGWTGTVWIKNIAIDGNNFGNVNNYGNEGSIVKFTGVTGWMNNGTQPGPAVELEDNGTTVALEINNGSSSSPITFAKLIGTGTLTTSGASSQKFYVADAADFTGAITMATGKGVLLGATEGTIANNQIVVADGAAFGGVLEAESIVFDRTVTIKGAKGDVIAIGLTAAPADLERVKVTMIDESGKATRGRLVYEDGIYEYGILTLANAEPLVLILR